MVRRYPVLVLAALVIPIASTALSRPEPVLRPGDPRPLAAAGTPFGATLADIQTNLFDPRCSFCHYEGSDLGNGLWLDTPDNSFETLVGELSPVCTDDVRVVPYDADASYLIAKLEGTHACGEQMPLGDEPLDAEVIGVVREWIENGAFREEPIPVNPTTWGAVKAGVEREVRTP